MSTIILPKGESIEFLDYIIKNSSNNDGIVLSKKRNSKGYKDYQIHLGNFGPGDQRSVDNAKIAAIIDFMTCRPETFAATIYYRIMARSGQYHEYYLLERELKINSIPMPEEITPGGGTNSQVYFKKEPLVYERSYK